ncbi:hypothetical protein EJ05DRAFT_506614 [Pseudovirgaria hyperparasitica]|uniref:Origin recognition complex subunit 4 n=1 Tax=Pseudovirgaria hyperparasitica TaxID=470096 RepID=A0A6A6WL67_9PEZI|nr:uncharacterized protein EJ05DRAFT_506614 [Pseudovirgaria hyperparasitica]KAF2762960.1 hypothetical protein EJ05DRAFT_506614 [Pseudovirgaria hyperparasitica]
MPTPSRSARRVASSQLAQPTTSNTPSKRKRDEDQSSVYDDFEGAHAAVTPLKRPRRGLVSVPSRVESPRSKETGVKGTPRKLAKTSPVIEDDEPAQTRTPRRKNGAAYREPGATPQSKKKQPRKNDVVDDHNEGTNHGTEQDDEDELAPKPVSTPKTPKSRKNRALDMLAIDMLPSGAKAPRSSVTQSRNIPILADEGEVDGSMDMEHSYTPGRTQKQMPRTPFTKKLLELSPNGVAQNRPVAEWTPKKPISSLQTGDVDNLGQLKLPRDAKEQFQAFLPILLERVTSKREGPLVGLDEEYAKVHQLLLNTVEAGEGNSMLLIGARGSGKSALVRKAISALSTDHADDFYTIHLNGFIHTDDKIALKEIWRQLGKEMEVDDDSKNYADTLLKLLALLSQPTEPDNEEAGRVAKAVIFIMDEFDLFASHPRQTLLYNLFDIAQSRKAPIAVLGLTTRIDVAESLEKRVKSRFSHRYVHTSLSKSLPAFRDLCRTLLTIEPTDLSDTDRHYHTFTPKSQPKSKTPTSPEPFLTAWNSAIAALFAHQRFISRTLAPIFHTTKSPAALLSTLHPYIASLSKHSTPPTRSTLVSSCLAHHHLAPPSAPDSKLHLLPSLSVLALSLLIAAARLDIITDAPSCNFNMAYAELYALATRARISAAASGQAAVGAGVRVWGREVARREWEKCVGWELLLPVVAGAAGAALAPTSMVRADVSLEEIAGVVGGLGVDRVVEGWCRQL